MLPPLLLQHASTALGGFGTSFAQKRTQDLFPLYGRFFLRHLKLSTIVYKTNYFIFYCKS